MQSSRSRGRISVLPGADRHRTRTDLGRAFQSRGVVCHGDRRSPPTARGRLKCNCAARWGLSRDHRGARNVWSAPFSARLDRSYWDRTMVRRVRCHLWAPRHDPDNRALPGGSPSVRRRPLHHRGGDWNRQARFRYHSVSAQVCDLECRSLDQSRLNARRPRRSRRQPCVRREARRLRLRAAYQSPQTCR